MIKEEPILMIWNVSNKEYYTKLGYLFTAYNDKFWVKSTELPVNSKYKVRTICDNCGKESKPKRRSIATSLCLECKSALREETWDEDEIQILKEKYSQGDIKDIAMQLGRTEEAIRIKAHRIGLKRAQKKKKYSDNPLNFNGVVSAKESKLFGYMIGDGWISLSEREGINEKIISYSGGFSGSIEGLENIIDDLKELFGELGVIGEIKSRNTKSYKYNISGISNMFSVNTAIVKHFLKLGMPFGERVEKEFLLPMWLLNGDKLVKASFISGIYAAEGSCFSMQSNDKTIRAPSFVITKRERLSDNFMVFIEQISNILNDLNISHNIKLKETYTKDYNIKALFVLSNNYENIFNIFNLLDLNYCKEKQNALNEFKMYYLAKALVSNLKELRESKNYFLKVVDELKQNEKEIILNVYNIYYKGAYFGLLPRNFPTFTEFKYKYMQGFK